MSDRAPDPLLALLAQRRRDAGLSQAALAARIGWCAEAVRCWELGRRRPSTAAVRAYAAAVGLELRLVESGVVL